MLSVTCCWVGLLHYDGYNNCDFPFKIIQICNCKLKNLQLCQLWFNFILGSSFIFLCFKLIIIHYNTQKQKKVKFEPRIKLNHNISILVSKSLHCLSCNCIYKVISINKYDKLFHTFYQGHQTHCCHRHHWHYCHHSRHHHHLLLQRMTMQTNLLHVLVLAEKIIECSSIETSVYYVTLDPLHPNISIHILHTVLFTFSMVLIRRICLTIMIL